MRNHSKNIFDSWDITIPEIPSRSKLFNLQPIGIGTPDVESLTSYLQRLSEAHKIPVTTLIKNYVLDLISTLDYSDYVQYIKQINGVNYKATETISALQNLTQRNDLSFLTLVNWSAVISLRKLLRHYRAWCSLCYEDMRTNRREIYDPLIWHLQVITVCSIHRSPLQTECPHCKKTSTHITRKSRLGYCSFCKDWLGCNENRIFYEFDEWDLWVNKNVGIMLSLTDLNLSNSSFTDAVKYYVDEFGNKHPYSFAEKIGISGSNFWDWYVGRYSRPLFLDLLRMCYRLGLTIKEFIDCKPIKVLMNNDSSINPLRVKFRFDNDHVKNFLENIINSNESPSLRDCAKRLGHTPAMLYKHFPELSKSVSLKYKNFRNIKGKERINNLNSKIREVMIRLHSAGIYPSMKRVQKEINTQKIFIRPESRKFWDEVMDELGVSVKRK